MKRIHYRLEDTKACLTIRMPAHKQWFAILVMAVVIFGFLFFFVADVMASLVREWQSSSFSLIVAIIIYTLLFLALLTWSIDLYWQFKGREFVEITYDSIAIHHQAGRLKVSRRCPSGQIERISVTSRKAYWKPGFFRTQDFLFLNFRYGRLEVAYRTAADGAAKYYRFGSALTDAEARQLVALIQERLQKKTTSLGTG